MRFFNNNVTPSVKSEYKASGNSYAQREMPMVYRGPQNFVHAYAPTRPPDYAPCYAPTGYTMSHNDYAPSYNDRALFPNPISHQSRVRAHQPVMKAKVQPRAHHQPVMKAKSFRKCPPVIKMVKILKKDVTNDTSSCPICFENVPHFDILTTQCGHQFCIDCVSSHFVKEKKESTAKFHSCPLCRQDITSVSATYSCLNAKNVKQYKLDEKFKLLRKNVQML